MSTDLKIIDAQHITAKDCNRKKEEFPLTQLGINVRPEGFQIVVRRSTLNAMKEHGRTGKYAEVGGMLVGNLYWNYGPFLVIEASIIGEHTDNQAASVTFTAETWEHVWMELGRNYPDTRIIGWYHTHPGFGIFLSDMDLFVCKHTFNAHHQVAYVYDPQSEKDGWFMWKNSVPKMVEALIVEDVCVLSLENRSHKVSRCQYKKLNKKRRRQRRNLRSKHRLPKKRCLLSRQRKIK